MRDKEREIKQAISRKIATALQETGLTYNEFGNKIGTKSGNITSWISGDHNFTVETLIKIGEALKIDFFNL